MSHPVIVYDGCCAVCSRFTMWVLRHDGGCFRLATQQSSFYRQLVAEQLTVYSVEKRDETVYLVEEGRVYARTAAVIRILSRCGVMGKCCSCLLRLFPPKLRDLVYAKFSSIRHKLQRKNTCPVPTKEMRDRIDLFENGM